MISNANFILNNSYIYVYQLLKMKANLRIMSRSVCIFLHKVTQCNMGQCYWEPLIFIAYLILTLFGVLENSEPFYHCHFFFGDI